jgi:N-acetylglucosaminyldiphosphoundecaprenol N-acetyl-beta-D-mannosaminyltransferase
VSKRYEIVNFLGYPIYYGNLSDISEEKCLINTINQYSYCIAEQDKEFKASLMSSDILLPDGVGIVSAIKLLYGKDIEKIAGADLHQSLLKTLNKNQGKCFYLGASEDTLKKIKARLSKNFPSIIVDTYSPPYKSEFSDIDNAQMIAAVNAFRPDVLFIGMTAPKQEKWSHMHNKLLDANIICSIGAVFDFYAGTVDRPGIFWINLGLEWLGRLIKEPKRMWKRYLYYGPIFVYYIIKEKIKLLLS